MSRLADAIDAIEQAVVALSSAVKQANERQDTASMPAEADGAHGAHAPEVPAVASEDELRAVKSELQEVMRLLEEVQAQPDTQDGGAA